MFIFAAYAIWQLHGYFFLDTPTMLIWAEAYIPESRFFTPDVFFPSAGRFAPLTQMAGSLWILIFDNPLWGNFLGQLILYSLAVVCIFYVMRRLKFSIWQVVFITLLIFAQTSIAENLFTIGKGETLLTSLSVFYTAVLYKFLFSERKAVLLGTLLGILSLLILLTKESGVALIAPLVFMSAVLLFFKLDRSLVKKMLAATIIFIFATAAHRLYVRFFDIAPVDYNPYIAFEISFRLMFVNLGFYLRNCTDIFITGTVSLLGNVYFFMKNKNKTWLLIGIFTSVWGWAFLGGMLFWRWPLVYYMLVPSTLFIVSLVFMLNEITRPLAKKVFYGVFAVFILLFAQYTFFVATSQGDSNRLYTQSMITASELLGEGANLYFHDWDFWVEPIHQTRLLHTFFLHSGINIYGLGPTYFLDIFDEEMARLHGLDERIEIPSPQAGDYVMVYDSLRPVNFSIRSVGPSFSVVSEPLLSQRGFGLELISADRFDRNHLFLGMAGIWGTLRTTAGYRLYRVTYAPEHTLLYQGIRGLYPDGWTGRVLSIDSFIGEELILYLNPASFAVHPQNSVRVFVNDCFAEAIPFDYTVASLDLTNIVSKLADSDGINIRIEVERLFNPSIDMPPSGDMRDLGLNVRVFAY
jgi:hypothetical protein